MYKKVWFFANFLFWYIFKLTEKLQEWYKDLLYIPIHVFFLYTWMASFSKFRTLICFEFIMDTQWQYEVWTHFYLFASDYQLSQHRLFKNSYFPQWLHLLLFTYQISICIHVYFWTFYTLLLFYLPFPIPTPHCFNHRSSVLCFNI